VWPDNKDKLKRKLGLLGGSDLTESVVLKGTGQTVLRPLAKWAAKEEEQGEDRRLRNAKEKREGGEFEEDRESAEQKRENENVKKSTRVKEKMMWRRGEEM
jgi:hypothetical protein